MQVMKLKRLMPHRALLILFVFVTACVATNKIVPEVPSGKKEVVYLLHGLGRSRVAMWVLASRLEDAGFLVNNIGYSSMSQTPDEILMDISGQINESLRRMIRQCILSATRWAV
jgi:hypothetical protein